MEVAKLGGGIGARVAGLVAATTPLVRAKTTKITHDTAMAVQHSFFGLVASEQRATTGRLFAELADHPETPDWAKRTFGFLARGSGQWQAFLAQSVAGTTIGVGLGGLVNNYLARPTGALIAAQPNAFISVADAAAMAAQRIRTFNQVEYDARAQGVRVSDFRNLVRLAQHDHSVGDAITLFNRGFIDGLRLNEVLRHNGFTEKAVNEFRTLAFNVYSPQEAATLENFGVISRRHGRSIAKIHGMPEPYYDQLVEGGGQPPPLEVLYEALRRGVISQSRFAKGVIQGPIRSEWTDVIQALRQRNTPVSMALSAATQNLIPEGRARRIWAEEGLIPGDFDWALESNGLPLGISQAAELFNRGKISRGAAEQMFLESNIKNKYVPLIFPLFERVPPMEQTIMLVREGVLTPAEGVRGLRDLGFNAERAGQLVDLGLRQKNAPDRNLSISTVQELYESQILSADQARDQLIALGFTRDEADWQLSIRDMRRERSRLNSAINRVRARFVGGKVTQSAAETALDQLQVRAAARDEFIDTWLIERDINRPALTTSQIQQATRAGLITPDDALERLVNNGYEGQDAQILVSLALPRS